MTRRIGRYKKNFRRADSDMAPRAAGPAICPPRTSAEQSMARAAASQFWNQFKRRPTTDEVNDASNQVYHTVYPEGPFQIPSADHPCADRWLNIRKHFQSKIADLQKQSRASRR